MTRWMTLIGLVSLITACATSPGQPAAAQADPPAKTGQIASTPQPEKDSDKVCTSGMEIGSHIPQRTCYTRKEADQRKKAAEERKKATQDAIRKMDNGSDTGSVICSPSC
jgi:hypothetical protein